MCLFRSGGLALNNSVTVWSIPSAVPFLIFIIISLNVTSVISLPRSDWSSFGTGGMWGRPEAANSYSQLDIG